LGPPATTAKPNITGDAYHLQGGTGRADVSTLIHSVNEEKGIEINQGTVKDVFPCHCIIARVMQQ
jgi:hypothetical protein